MHPESKDQKSELRQMVRQQMRGKLVDSVPVADAFVRWLLLRPELQTIAIYSALPGEVDLSGIIPQVPGRSWGYPRVMGETLKFHAVNHPAHQLQVGSFGILEPDLSLPEIPIGEIDLFVCPGQAFDSYGGRLGRGRGFYDRILAAARPDAWKVGICFPEQIVPSTHAEPHDIPMNHVIFG